MACGCNKGPRTQFEVVAENGKVVFTSPTKATADTVSKRYPNSTVRPQGTGTPATAPLNIAPAKKA